MHENHILSTVSPFLNPPFKVELFLTIHKISYVKIHELQEWGDSSAEKVLDTGA